MADFEKRSAKARRLPSIERARALRDLGVEAKELYAAAADEAVAEAVAEVRSYVRVGSELRVTRQAVNKAVVRHRSRRETTSRLTNESTSG